MTCELTEVGPFGGSKLDAKIVNAVYYAEVNATTGTISAPTGGTFVADRFSSGVDALCTKITASSPPDDEAATEADGTPVLVSSFTVATGAFVLSGAPSSYPVALVFAYSIALEDFDSSKTIEAVYIDELGTGGGAIDYANPVSITTTAALTSTAVGKHHVCTGVTTDYAVTLPVSGLSIGDCISFEMSSLLSKVISIDAGSGVVIKAEQLLKLIATDILIVKWDGTNWNWWGSRIAPSFVAELTGVQVIPTTAWTQANLAAASLDTHGVFSVGLKGVTLPKGRWLLSAMLLLGSGVDQKWMLGAIYKNGVRHKDLPYNHWSGTSELGTTVTVPVESNGTDVFTLYVIHINGGNSNLDNTISFFSGVQTG